MKTHLNNKEATNARANKSNISAYFISVTKHQGYISSNFFLCKRMLNFGDEWIVHFWAYRHAHTQTHISHIYIYEFHMSAMCSSCHNQQSTKQNDSKKETEKKTELWILFKSSALLWQCILSVFFYSLSSSISFFKYVFVLHFFFFIIELVLLIKRTITVLHSQFDIHPSILWCNCINPNYMIANGTGEPKKKLFWPQQKKAKKKTIRINKHEIIIILLYYT